LCKPLVGSEGAGFKRQKPVREGCISLSVGGRAGPVTFAPDVLIRAEGTGLRTRRTFIPYACAGSPAIDDACTLPRAVTAGATPACRVGRADASKRS